MPKLFLDNDGVLAAFDEHVLALFGAGCRELGDQKLWQNVDATPDFWATIPVKQGALELWEVAAPFSPTILTGCPKTSYDVAAAHKPLWVKKHFGADVPVITCLSKDKPKHMVAPGDILVDDFIVNIRRWEKAGGVGIYYNHPDRGLARLVRELEKHV